MTAALVQGLHTNAQEVIRGHVMIEQNLIHSEAVGAMLAQRTDALEAAGAERSSLQRGWRGARDTHDLAPRRTYQKMCSRRARDAEQRAVQSCLRIIRFRPPQCSVASASDVVSACPTGTLSWPRLTSRAVCSQLHGSGERAGGGRT